MQVLRRAWQQNAGAEPPRTCPKACGTPCSKIALMPSSMSTASSSSERRTNLAGPRVSWPLGGRMTTCWLDRRDQGPITTKALRKCSRDEMGKPFWGTLGCYLSKNIPLAQELGHDYKDLLDHVLSKKQQYESIRTVIARVIIQSSLFLPPHLLLPSFIARLFLFHP